MSRIYLSEELKTREEVINCQDFRSSAEYKVALKICKTLKQAGFLSYFAGGCVRDALLGKQPNDFDVATEARPEEVARLFPKTLDLAKKYGVTIVIEAGFQIEVTTFRSDLAYVNGRQPEGVVYASPEDDAQRRDFTINALFMDPESEEIFDYVGGLADIHGRILRTVGKAKARFSEDHLRILRGIRFVSQLGFELEKQTRDAIIEQHPFLKKISVERLREELQKLLCGNNLREAMQILASTGTSQTLFGPVRIRKWPLVTLNSTVECSAEAKWWIFLMSTELASESLQQKQARILDLLKAWKFPKHYQHNLPRIFSVDQETLHFEDEIEQAQFLSYFFEPVLREYWTMMNAKNVDRNFNDWREKISQLPEEMPKALVGFLDLPKDLQNNKPAAGAVLKRCHLLQILHPGIEKAALIEKATT